MAVAWRARLMSDDPMWEALLKKYGKVYDLEANNRALEEKAKLVARQAAFKTMFPDREPRDR
jgi:hypothetical protein